MTDDRNPHGDPNQGNPYQGHPAQNAHQHGERQQPSAPRDPWSPGAGYHPTTPQGAGGYPGYPQQPGTRRGTARPSRSRRSVPREPCPPPVRRRRPPSPGGWAGRLSWRAQSRWRS
ncbi:hypothetical protein GS929_00350 [Rhodococcus hoagii]|nr:hypothetical protein [Prescottella equi]